MKVFLVLLFVGFASAILEGELQNVAKNAVGDFINGLQTATPLHVALGVDNSKDVQRLERDVKEELKKHIEEAFDKALKKIEDAIANNKQINQKALEMLKALREKMKDLNIEDHEMEEELDALKAKVDEHLRNILEKMGILDKRSVDPEMQELLQGVLGDSTVKDMLSKLRKWILEKLDVKSLKQALVKIIGQGTKRLCEWITTKGREKILNFFDYYLVEDSENLKRASEDRFQEIKDYLKNVEDNIDDKLAKFKKWLHELLDKGVDKAKGKVQKVTEIIKNIIAESKNASKKGLVDILEHIRKFEDKFGSLFDLGKETLKKKD